MLTAALAVAALAAVATGALAAALVPREMEGVLTIIGAVGIQVTAGSQSWMPMWGAGQLIRRAAGAADAATTGAAVVHTVIFTAALLAVGITLWARRTKLRPPTRVLPTGESAAPSDDSRPVRRQA